MRLRSHRRNLAVWSPPAGRAGRDRAPPPTFARRGPIRRAIRTGALLALIGLVRLARGECPRWRAMLVGGTLTAVGLILRSGAGGLLLLPGLLALLSILLIPPGAKTDRVRHSALTRELALYSTPAQRRDLEATLDRYPDNVTHELRDILAGQAGAPRTSRVPGAG